MTMKRVRRKEAIGNNNLQCTIPEDLIIEILAKLPPKTIVKLIIVSKLWFSIICSKHFTDLFLSRSWTRPRFLFAFQRQNKMFLHSFSKEDTSCYDHHHKVDVTRWGLNPSCEIYQPVRGLICCRYNTKVVIGNPSTGQYLTLPRIKTQRIGISTFFGYDRVNDVYKVLCMTVKQGALESEEHQVFTLGAQQKKWRMIKCKLPPHVPHCGSKGICKDGVVYYSARVDEHEHSLISFDLRSEDFSVIKLPDQDLKFYNLVNYGEKIALTSKSSCNGTVNLWVLEDASKQEWLKVSVLVPSWKDLIECYRFWNLVKGNIFRFEGALSTGELIFASYNYSFPKWFCIIRYNPKESLVKKGVIQGSRDDFVTQIFMDHVESTMILPKGKLIR